MVIGGKNDGKLIEFKTRKFLGREQDYGFAQYDLVSRHHCVKVYAIDECAVRLGS